MKMTLRVSLDVIGPLKHTEATFFVSSLVFDMSKPMQMICGVEDESTQKICAGKLSLHGFL